MVDHSRFPDRCHVCMGRKGPTLCGKKNACLNSHRKRCGDCRKERTRIEDEAQAALASADVDAHRGVA